MYESNNSNRDFDAIQEDALFSGEIMHWVLHNDLLCEKLISLLLGVFLLPTCCLLKTAAWKCLILQFGVWDGGGSMEAVEPSDLGKA
jgi:hypothetical protein